MRADHSNWRRVSAQYPCPICGKADNCQVTPDESAVWCGRVPTGSLRQNHGGQFLHLRKNNISTFLLQSVARLDQAAPRYELGPLADQLYENGVAQRKNLASILGVDEQSLEQLRVGWNPVTRIWSFPEKNASGRIVGISARHENGDKKRLSGSKMGLTYAVGWDLREGPILLVEGGSDTAALLGLNLCVVGRPSNFGGVDLLTELLLEQPLDRDIIVVAENDQKPDGKWPGKEGAIRTAERLALELNRTINWSLPPDHAKDARVWLNTMPELPVERLRALWLSGLDAVVVRPPPRHACELPRGSPTSLADWRESMLEARLSSLAHPGLYLDRSATGAGKSYVDFAAIEQLIGEEAAA